MKYLKIIVIIVVVAALAVTLGIFLTKEEDGHVHDPIKREAVSATCVEAGSAEYWECADCGLVFSDEACTVHTTVAAQTISPRGHSWTAADCDAARTCSACGVTDGEPMGHDWADADCDTPKTCSSCGKTEGEPAGHSWADADCDTPKTCSACGVTDGEPMGHSWTAADCDAARMCSVCGVTDGEPMGHSWTAANCVAPKTCSVCGETEGVKKGHSWTAADCVAPKTCSVCGETEGVKKGHSWTAADCDTPKTCSACGETEGDALGHSYDTEDLIWVWDMTEAAPTCQLKLICTRDSEHISMLDAVITANTLLKPTCKAGGSVKHTATVKYNGADLTDERTVDTAPLDHEYNWEGGEWVWASDLSSATLSLTCTLGDTHVDTFDAAASRSETPASCTEDGALTHTVTVNVMGRDIYDIKETPLPKTGHKYIYDSVTWSADGEAGVIKLVCENDPRHEYTDIASVSRSITKEATCIKKGVEHRVASIEYEGEIYYCECDSEILAKGHSYEGDICVNCQKHVPSEKLSFEKLSDGSGYRVTGIGECEDEIISIPDTYKGLPVLEIGSNAFYNNADITEIYLSDNVISVGDYAFNGCLSLVRLDLGVSVETVGKNAFAYCSSLESIIIPDSTVKIKDSAFNGCTGARELRLGAGVKSIYNYAFGNIPLIREVVLPDGINDIGDYAFMDCISLTSLTVPKSVTYLPSSAFSGCIRLLEIKNLSRVQITASAADNFFLKNVYTEDSGEGKLYTDDDGFVIYKDGSECILLAYHGSADSVVLPQNINGNNYSLWHYCFYDVSFRDGLLHIPDAVTSIGSNICVNNKTLLIVDGGKGVTSIGSDAFNGCSELLSFTFGAQLGTIGTNAFRSCPKLMDVINHSRLVLNAGTAGNNYAALNAYKVHTGSEDGCHITFDDDGLIYYFDGTACFLVGYRGAETELVLPEGFNQMAYHIYKRAFYNNTSIKRVSISSVTPVIGESAFEGCSSLTLVTITGMAYTTKRIEDRAFLGTAITSFKFPSTLEYLGADALPDTLIGAEFEDKEGWYYVRSGLDGTGLPVGEHFSEVNSNVAEYLLSMDGYYFYKKSDV